VFRTWIRKLSVTAAVAAVLATVGLTVGLFNPAQAAGMPGLGPGLGSAVAADSPSPSPTGPGATLTASSVPEMQGDVSADLAANGASSAWPAVNADLTPKLNGAVAAGGGGVLSDVLALPFKIVITCTITYPPLKIECNVRIELQVGGPSPVPSPSPTGKELAASSVPEMQGDVSADLAANGASSAWPAVNADLTPKLNAAVAAGGGLVQSDAPVLPFRIVINCTISYPPLKIVCTVQIQIQP